MDSRKKNASSSMSSDTKSDSPSTKRTKKVLAQEKINKWMANFDVKDPTDSENQILDHYKAYTRRSPNQLEMGEWTVHNFGAPRGPYKIHSRIKMPDVFPSSVIVLITMHGRTKEPMTLPVNVVRYIGTDFGTCYFNGFWGVFNDRDIIISGFKKKRKVSGEAIKANLVSAIAVARERKESRTTKYEHQEDFELFKASKYHNRPKKFKQNMPMFNKEYEFEPDDPHYMKHNIYVRGDLPEGSTEKDIFFEIHAEKTTLFDIFFYLTGHGVTDVTLFDLSCQGDDRSPIHRKRYGGTKRAFH